MTEGYVELHGRWTFSFLEGASVPEATAEQAASLGMPALGILDRDGLYGAPRLYMTAKKLGLSIPYRSRNLDGEIRNPGASRELAASHHSGTSGATLASLQIADRLQEPVAADHHQQRIPFMRVEVHRLDQHPLDDAPIAGLPLDHLALRSIESL